MNDSTQLSTIIEREVAGEQQAVYRLKSPVGVWDDPVARMMDLIRLQPQKGMGQDAHRAFCQTPDDLMIHEALYGDMSSSQRANVLTKISKQLFEKQQEVLKQANITRQREDKQEAAMLKARAALRKRAEKGQSE